MECDGCHREYSVLNDKPDSSVINSLGTWAAISSGVGFTQFENILAVLNVPSMSFNTFVKKECDLEKVTYLNSLFDLLNWRNFCSNCTADYSGIYIIG